ncbi:tRNA pseudouridine38/39 synthase [Nematocida minor]|uniref:tRNA pseudouridine38/39 synthase n=1 Tax=Nematocida minor TaxID=1912983 RepID=UPI00221FAFE2|nr:tRNA pseudouridine38/39 synthase [Nematocida minor]KAI5192149.1 tRNA pseudouridine38/39 synthase [Nematocida minor]
MKNNISMNVLLKLSYSGDAYHGFAYQPSLPTVEHYLFWSFIKCNFVSTEESIPDPKTFTFSKSVLTAISEMKYYKCGRTDAGVSAAAQYISIFLPCAKSGKSYPYDVMLNQHLPDSIRILGWMPVEETFSARFSCTSREYEYYFAKGTLSIEKMQKASSLLVGTHWFGRLSKQEKEVSKKKRLEKKQKLSPDETQAEESVRTVDSIRFEKVSEDSDTGVEVYLMRIKARSFLHNQVRKIFSLLSMIGAGSDIRIENILNKNEKQEKDIKLSDPCPLVLAECTFGTTDLTLLSSTPIKSRLFIKLCEDVSVASRVKERITKEPLLKIKNNQN